MWISIIMEGPKFSADPPDLSRGRKGARLTRLYTKRRVISTQKVREECQSGTVRSTISQSNTNELQEWEDTKFLRCGTNTNDTNIFKRDWIIKSLHILFIVLSHFLQQLRTHLLQLLVGDLLSRLLPVRVC